MDDQRVGPGESGSGFAVVRFGIDRWRLRAGDEITFGRARDRDIRIGHNPSDDLISRNAGSLTGLRDGVLIRNASATRPVRLIAVPGPEFSVGPGMTVGTMPFRYVRLEILGRHGACYSLHIDSRDVAGRPRPAPTGGSGSGVAATRAGPAHELTPRERLLLTALCEPALTLAGSPPATYRQIAERLGGATTPKSVRTGLDRLRNRLADEDGIPGLRTDDDDGCSTPRYVEALARWAIDSGQIDRRDLRGLPPRRTASPDRSTGDGP